MASGDKARIYGGAEVVWDGLRLLEARADIDPTQDTQHLYQTANLLKSTTLRLDDRRSGRDCK